MKNDKFTANPEPTTVLSVVEDTVSMIQLQAKYHSVSVVIDSTKLKFEKLMIDKLRFQQVVLNLLTNAIKFSPSGGKV